MTQNAVVTRIIDRRTAEVEVERGTACGGNCGACDACVFQNTIRAAASNRISALPGQQVIIESRTLYLIPFVLLFLGYAVGSLAHLAEGGCILVGGLFFAVGVAVNVIRQRRKKSSGITFDIIAIRE